MGLGDLRQASAILPQEKKLGALCTGGLVVDQGWSGRLRKISLPPGFDPRTFQPVASRYTDCVVPASNCRK